MDQHNNSETEVDIVTIYDRIERNRRNVKILFTVYGFAYLVLILWIALVIVGVWLLEMASDGYHFAVPELIKPMSVIVAVITLVLLARTYWKYQHFSSRILRIARARRCHDQSVVNLAENVALASGVDTPRLYVIRDKALNAFSIGFDRPVIVVTSGLFDNFSKYELEAVFAHEIMHVRAGDSRVESFVVLFTEAIENEIGDRSVPQAILSIVGYLGVTVLFWLCGVYFLTIILMFFVPFGIMGNVLVIVVAVLPKKLFANCDYLADYNAVQLTRNPEALISAFKKLEESATLDTRGLPKSILFIADPKLNMVHYGNGACQSLYLPITSRIQRIKTLF